jgi:NAD(P)-dependent dehydrogenase (short-subunit alcohol dehydrogenase family)
MLPFLQFIGASRRRTQMERLTGKTALITGGTTGIGLATARLFLAEGARVAITGQDAERVKQAGAELGARAIAIRANAAVAGEMADVARRIKSEFGGLDIVFANAGVAKFRPFAEITEEHIAEHFDVNVRGVIWSIQKMLPLLRRPASVILNATTLVEQAAAGMSVYAASKAAVASLGRALAAELVGQGVRVNVISPGPIETPIFGKLGLTGDALQQMAAHIVTKVPMGRVGHVDEIAKAVLFLASEESSYITGENLLVDGGMARI